MATSRVHRPVHIAQKLAHYADDLTYDDLDDATVEATKLRLLDSIACSYAAMREPSVETLVGHLRERPGEEARIIGGGASSVENATFANGSLVRYVDWNDTIFPGGHPSDNFGAVLSVADAAGASGEAVVLASVLGYEVQSRLAAGHPVWLSKDGLDHTTNGLPSSALAAGTLLGLSADEMTEAVNMALGGNVPVNQIRNGRVSDFKGMAFANASRNAVFSAGLAGVGLTGPQPVWEGEDGLNNLLSADVEVDVGTFGGNGGTFKLLETNLKPYPCFYHGQAAADCVRALLGANDVEGEEVVSIEAETYQDAYLARRSEQWRPTTRGAADHSLPWVIARAFLEGGIFLSQYEPGDLLPEPVSELMEKITITVNDEFTARYPDEYPHRLTVETTEGVYEASVDYARGHHESPLSREEVAEKLRGQYEHVADGDPQPLIDWVWALEEHDSVDGLFEHAAV